MRIVRVAEQDVHSGQGYQAKVLANASKGSKDLRIYRMKMDSALSGPPNPHKHDRDEITVVLTGSANTKVGDRTHRLSPGDVLIIPAGTLHQGGRPEPGQSYEVIIIQPAGTRYLDADGKEIPAPPWGK